MSLHSAYDDEWWLKCNYQIRDSSRYVHIAPTHWDCLELSTEPVDSSPTVAQCLYQRLVAYSYTASGKCKGWRRYEWQIYHSSFRAAPSFHRTTCSYSIYPLPIFCSIVWQSVTVCPVERFQSCVATWMTDLSFVFPRHTIISPQNQSNSSTSGISGLVTLASDWRTREGASHYHTE